MRSSKIMGEAASLATWSHHDLSKTVTVHPKHVNWVTTKGPNPKQRVHEQ